MKKRMRKARPQRLQHRSLMSLKQLLPDHTQGAFSPHFKTRIGQRSFDLNLLDSMWYGDQWQPAEGDRWKMELPIESEELVWSIVFDFVDDLPYFVTVCARNGGAQ